MATFGLNISGGEFGGTGGTHGVNYWYPTWSDLKYYADKGVDLIRLPIRWERVQDALDGPLDLSGDIALIKQVLADAASLGMNVIIDVHNYGRYQNVPIGAAGGPTAAQFADFWKKMAVEFKDYPAVVGYDLMNEPNNMPGGGVWKAAAQAATNAIRTVDMDTIIYIEGEGWSAAHTWQTFNSNLIINDPANKLIYQAHGYYDDNNSGTYNETYEGEGANPMTGVARLTPFVEWLKAHNLKGMIGEFGIPSNDPRWLEVQKNTLDYMAANGLDATAWGGGSWGTDYHHYTARPGSPDSAYMDLLEAYFNPYKDPFDTSPSPAPGAPTVAVNDVTMNEATGFLTFTVKRSGDLSQPATVDYSTADGSATAGSDYTAVTGTISFAAGQTTALVTIPLTNDTLVEDPETLVINLTNGTGVTVSDAQGVGTVNSEDTGVTPPPGFPTTPTISGTDGNDIINARDNTVDYINAKGGDDVINSVWSQDFVDGGIGSDTISYHWSSGAVDVDLTRSSQVGGDANGDAFINIENITGSGRNDILRGDDGANVIKGLGGQDVFTGRGGSDRFVFTTAVDSNGDVITDYSSADQLDFTAFNPVFLAITNDGVNTRIIGDTNSDGVGDFTVTLNGVHTSVNGVTIGSAPPPPPAITINDVTADETGGTITFAVTRSGDLSRVSTVNYVTADGTAVAGSDYVAASGTVSFAAGQATTLVTVQVTNDTLVESPETLFLNLTGGTNVTISDAQGVGTVNSEDTATTPPPAGFPTSPTIVGTDAANNMNAGASTIDYVDAKGGDDLITGVGSKDYIDGGTGNDTISYHWSGAAVDVDLLRSAQKNGDASGDVLVNIENIRGSARNDLLAGDNGANVINGLGGQDRLSGRDGSDRFVFSSAADANGDVVTDYSSADTLDFSAFNPSFLAITNDGVNTRIIGDTNNDGVGDFTVTLSGVHTSVNGVTVGSTPPPPPPPPPPPTIAINDVTADETAGTVTFTVTRSGSLTAASSVNFATADGTATAGADYTALSGTVSFAAGEASKTVTVAVTNDALVEGSETFTVNLTGGTNVTIADAQGVGTINSEDVPAPSAPAIAVTDVTVNEAAGPLTFTITRSGDLSLASTVNFATADGTATAGTDYVAANGTVSFAAGQATATVSVQITNDTLVESPETLFLNLTAGTNATISDAQGVGTVNSDDTGTGTAPPAGFPTSPTIVGTDANNNINAGASTVDYVDAKGGDDSISGVGSKDYIDGGAGNDTISYHWSGAAVDVDLLRSAQKNGDASGDVLVNIENVTGSARNDLVAGDNGANVLNGLGGQDTLTGRGGGDRFVFNSAINANGDVVTDFASGDMLDFGLIDANAGLAGDQAFTWLDTGEFTGAAGQLREYDLAGVHYVAGDIDGDKVSDFVIKLSGVGDLSAADLLL
jgi:aryl-phospho-beta-D-glucosidase BglC (GH1 family)/Ca2+-binding RTX toxin-like protein